MMKSYKNKITLVENRRGCYILDTVKGCSACVNKPRGCYGDCYAKNISARYGFDFSKPIDRIFEKEKTGQLYFLDFYDSKHEDKIIYDLKKIKMPFVRIGEMGDPSENWEHTINVCETIKKSGKKIVIITKHLKQIPKHLLKKLRSVEVCINTSISALDSDTEISYRLHQYNMLKKYCNSVLRVVTCEFNVENEEGFIRDKIQKELLKNEKVIDTIFRPSRNNPSVLNKVVKTKKVKFLKSEVLASVYSRNTFFGYCKNCKEMCGINL
jgi:hypothetical protein